MSSKYWLKLYHEMLDDPKVMTLRPALRWRFIETLLVAGEVDQGGVIPGVKDYAWRVRDNAEQVETELIELVDAGLLSRDDTIWRVTKFDERQAAESSKERMRRYRARQKKQDYYGDLTDELRNSDEDVTKRNTDKIREDKEQEPDKSGRGDYADLVRAYEKNIGVITQMVAETLKEDLEEYGLQLCLDAMHVAVNANKRRWNYVQGILKNWKRNGRTEKGDKKERMTGTHKVVLPNGEIVEEEL